MRGGFCVIAVQKSDIVAESDSKKIYTNLKLGSQRVPDVHLMNGTALIVGYTDYA